MADLHYVPVSHVNFSAFTAAFNLAYSDYFVPITMTIPSFRALIKRDDLSLDASVAAVDKGKIVGTGLLGIRGQHGWIGGMGVIPERRRQGIGRHMMHYLLDQAARHRLTQIDLEVIEANTGAHALYDQLGFTHQRYLLVLERDSVPVKSMSLPYRVEERPVSTLLDYYSAYHNAPNCWQRDLGSLRALSNQLQGWAALENNTIAGYALGWASVHGGVYLADIAADPHRDQARIAHALLAYLHECYSGEGSSYNLAETDPTLPAFEAMGYTVSFRQIEMRYYPNVT